MKIQEVVYIEYVAQWLNDLYQQYMAAGSNPTVGAIWCVVGIFTSLGTL